MRTKRTTAAMFCAAAFLASGPSGGEENRGPEAARTQAAAVSTAPLETFLGTLDRRGSVPEAEAAIRKGPELPKDAPKGKLAKIEARSRRYGGGAIEVTEEFPVSCDHVNYESTCYLYVPTSYDASKPHPLCVVFMGGNWDKTVQDARAITLSYIKPWIEPAERLGVIVIAPVCTRGWGNLGRSLTRTAMRQVRERYNVDPDRVFCWGQSMGGHCCWREGLYTPDDWCGVAPVCGGYDWHAPQLPQMTHLAIYQVWGNADPHPAGLGATNRFLAEKIRELGLNAVCVPKPGGHELFAEEIPALVGFFLKNPRNLYPRKVVASATCSWINDVDQKQRWTGDYAWSKPMVWGRFYWTRLGALREEGKAGHWEAGIADGNRIVLKTNNIKELDLFLHDRMLDLDQPVVVVANGKEAFKGKVERSVETMLEEVRASGDRGRIYPAKLTVRPEGDDASIVPPPFEKGK